MQRTDRTNLRYFVLSGIFNTIMLNLYNPFVVKFLQRLEGNELHISLLNSIPGLAGIIASLPGALFIIRRNQISTKNHLMKFIALSRLMLLGFALMPLVPREIAPWLFLSVYIIKSLPETISQTAFQGFTGDLFDDHFRSTAISQRNKLGTPIAIIISLTSGYLLRAMPKSEEERMLYYQIFFVVSAIFGIFEILSYKFIHEPENKAEIKDLKLKALFKDLRGQKSLLAIR